MYLIHILFLWGRFVYVLFFHLRLCLLSGLILSDFVTKILYAFLNASYMPHPSHPPWLGHTGWSIQIMKLHIIRFSPTSCYFIRLRSKYFSQNPVLRDLQCIYFCQSEEPNFTHTQKEVLFFILYTDLWDRKTKYFELNGTKHSPKLTCSEFPCERNCPMGTGGSFPGGKAAGAWSWPLTSS
jgi:hypothetical protein